MTAQNVASGPDHEVRTFSVDRVTLESREDDNSLRLSGYAAVFDRETDIAGLFDEVIRRGARLRLTRPLPKAPDATEVRIDNETSDSFTIVDVFADDRQGLLHVITNAIFQLGLSIHAARISTRLDQVADVFYVTDQAGKKLSDHAQLERVRAGVEQAVEQFLVIKAA